MNQYLVAFLLEEPETEHFARWPLHITVVPWFTTDAESLIHIEDGLRDMARGARHFKARVDKGALFGRRHTIPVSLIEPQDTLGRIHNSVVNVLESAGVSPDDHRWCREQYRPHITHQKSKQPQPNGIYNLDTIALVQSLGDTPRLRQIIRRYPFGV